MADESFDRLLRRRLREDETPGHCPDPAVLAAFAELRLSPVERQSVESHAASCSRCSAELALLLDALSAVQPTRAREVRGWRHWRWAVPAATAILVFGVWTETARRAEQRAAVHSDAPILIEPDAAQKPAPGRRTDALASREDDRQPAQVSGAEPPAPATGPMRRARRDARAPTPPPPPAKTQAEQEFLRLGEAEESGRSAGAADAGPQPPAAASQAPRDLAANSALHDAAGDADAVRQKSEGARAPAPASPSAEAPAPAARELRKSAHAEEPIAMAGPGGLRVRVTAAGIERSIDAGASWTLEHPMPDLLILTGRCPDVETCWVGGEGGLVLRREASGRWVNVSIPEGTAVRSLEVADARQATAVMDGGRRVRTRDGGRTWSAVP